MPKVDLIVHGPHFFTMAGPGVGYLPSAAMAVDRGRIAAIGPAAEVRPAYQAERTIDASHHAVLPGFVDAHIHTNLALLRGLAQDTRGWMMRALGPFLPTVGRAEVETASSLAIVESIRAGTTTIGDWGPHMEATCEAIKRAGLRARVATLIHDAVTRIYQPGELYEFAPALGRSLLEENIRLFEGWDGAAGGRISVVFGPQAADFASPELLLETRRAALERKTMVWLHTAQGRRETDQMLARYGLRSVPWLDGMGYLDRNLVAVHLTDATEEEAALIAKRGGSMVLCSMSIGIIYGAVPPAGAFQEAGGMVGLGSDQPCGNNCSNVIDGMKATALFNKIRAADPEVMPAWKVLRMATIEGARAIGLGDEVGSLEAGKKADFILVDLRKPTMMPVHTYPMRNIVPNLVYSARGDEVSMVVCDGRVIYEGGRILGAVEGEAGGPRPGFDEEAVLDAAQAAADRIGPRAARAFERVDGPSARFMREGKL